MSGGVPWLTLPAGYLGSSLIGACLIACGFDTKASKIASLIMAGFFLFTLWWARRSWLSVRLSFFHPAHRNRRRSLFFRNDSRTWLLILGMSGLVVLFWLVADGLALRFFVCRSILLCYQQSIVLNPFVRCFLLGSCLACTSFGTS